MRIADTILTPKFRIVVYTLEAHWYLEFEAGPMKQGYKLSKEKYPSLEDAKALITDDFLATVYQNFNHMYLGLKAVEGNQ